MRSVSTYKFFIMESKPLVGKNNKKKISDAAAATASSGRPMKQQYHFFYGSTGDGDADATDASSRSHMTGSLSHQQGEQESLIGESLVPTDNEEEPPTANANDYDLQHVLISSGGRNGGMRHVMGVNGGNKKRGINNQRNSKHDENGSAYGSGSGGRNGSFNGVSHHPLGGAKSIRRSLVVWRENNPVWHVIVLVGFMTLCMVVFAITLFPKSTQSAAKDATGAAASSIFPIRKFVLKFPIVDRSKSNDPVRAFLRKDLFHPNLVYQGSNPFQEFTFAFPTGAFWTNLAMPPTADRGFSYPIVVYPYAYKWSDSFLSTSYPALHRKEETKAIHDYYFPDLTFGSVEEVQNRQITGFDPLSVSLQFLTASGGSWQTFLVQGSPYVTIEYNNVKPRIKALSVFKSVACPGDETSNSDDGGGDDYSDFDDNFSDDDPDSGGRSRRRRRKLLGVCGTSVRKFILPKRAVVEYLHF